MKRKTIGWILAAGLVVGCMLIAAGFDTKRKEQDRHNADYVMAKARAGVERGEARRELGVVLDNEVKATPFSPSSTFWILVVSGGALSAASLLGGVGLLVGSAKS